MNKLTIFLVVAFFATTGFAEQTIEEQRLAWTKEHFAKQGMPVPDGGITIMPRAKMKSYNKFMADRKSRDIKKYGYQNDYDSYISVLKTIKEEAARAYINYESKPYKFRSTQLRHTIDELTLAYTFLGVPKNDISELIGVSPYLGYIDGKGWASAIEYFVNDSVGTCSYSENNTLITHAAVILAEEDITYDINNKVTTIDIIGTEELGFLYSVEWYDHTFFRELKCYNKIFAIDILDNVKSLANKIDLNQ